jgi:hypothetical protein
MTGITSTKYDKRNYNWITRREINSIQQNLEDKKKAGSFTLKDVRYWSGNFLMNTNLKAHFVEVSRAYELSVKRVRRATALQP